MILGLPGHFFKTVEIEIFMKYCGPILGSKKIYLGSKIDIFGPIWPKKWKISWKHNTNMDDSLLCQFFEPVEIEIFLKFLEPISGYYLVGP